MLLCFAGTLGGICKSRVPEFRDAVSVLILTILTASQAPLVSLDLLFLRHDLRYVLIRLRALSANSGNCLVQESIMACIFSLGCLDIGTIRSRFSSTNRRTNIQKTINKQRSRQHNCVGHADHHHHHHHYNLMLTEIKDVTQSLTPWIIYAGIKTYTRR